jgi:uncharacterized protein YeaO (DUF488 family)
MQTSYFSKAANDMHAVSIARIKPKWFHGPEYLTIAPTFRMLADYKKGGGWAHYVEQFRGEILDNLDPQTVYEEIADPVAVLICYESDAKMCHRSLVAEWFTASGIPVSEKVYPRKEKHKMRDIGADQKKLL